MKYMDKCYQCTICGGVIIPPTECDYCAERSALKEYGWDYREASSGPGPGNGDIVKNWFCPECKKKVL